ncbi:glycosyltransferase [uncultured Deinococcus sp.]|uniref:glycosyltransferase n=1 Tax=uncultured Deinococcus sp. TaxID=158789 RepID=UPI0025DA3313|nr:glycosyltransferase [uncultured Deinococcus sp.]
MKLNVVIEHRFIRTPNGDVWTYDALPYPAWQPYLETFKEVNVIARIEDVDAVDTNAKLSSGIGVKFSAIPYYIGPLQFISRYLSIRNSMHKALDPDSATMLRLPGTLAAIAYQILKATGRPYGAQIVGDPHEVFAPGAVRHPLRPFFRWWFTHQLKIQARKSSVISYVTRHTLQKRYPSHAVFSNSFSNVQLPVDAFIKEPRANWDGLGKPGHPCRLVLVGSLAQLYKSPDVLLQSVALCKSEGLHVNLTIVGEGKHRVELEALAAELDVQDQVVFRGQLPAGEPIRQELDRAHIFVLPSRTEGLPRAMIEAMARAMPCIGSSVGGIPELLSEENMVPPGDPAALAHKIQEVATSPQRLREMSMRNLEIASKYTDEILNSHRKDFLDHLAHETALWTDTISRVANIHR